MTEQTILQKIMGSKIGQEIIRKEKQDTLRKRKQAVEAIKGLKAEAGLIVPPLRKEFEKELEKVKEVEKKLKVAQMRHGEAYRKMYGKSHYFNAEIAKHEIFLNQSFDPAITEFLSEVNRLIDHWRNCGGPELLKEERLLIGTMNRTYDFEGHQNTKNKIAEIYEMVDALKMQSIDDVPAKLIQLRQALPQNQYTRGFYFK